MLGCKNRPEPWSAARREYYSALRELGPSRLQDAVSRWIASPHSGFFPKPGELIALVADDIAEEITRDNAERARNRAQSMPLPPPRERSPEEIADAESLVNRMRAIIAEIVHQKRFPPEKPRE